jgi:hypothetical protein
MPAYLGPVGATHSLGHAQEDKNPKGATHQDLTETGARSLHPIPGAQPLEVRVHPSRARYGSGVPIYYE